ncbi:hypothetical protein D3C72_2133880 [compost metagenome]
MHAHDLEEQVFLAGEVVVKVRLRGAAGLCDLDHGGSLETLAGEQRRGLVQDRLSFVVVVVCAYACHGLVL